MLENKKVNVEITLWKDGGTLKAEFDNKKYEILMSAWSCITINSVINAVAQQCVMLSGERFFLPDTMENDEENENKSQN